MRAGPDNRRIRFVSFSGIDGAGKTTQIDALRTSLEEAGLRVLLLSFWNDVARLTRIREVTGHTLFKGDKGAGTPDAPINRRDKNVRSWAMTLVRLLLYFVDAVSLRFAVKKALKSDIDFVIFDRYTYDELANLKLSNPANQAYIRLIVSFVPKPHISYLLDADPVQARARKPEYPLEFLYTNRESYLALNKLIGGLTVISPTSIEDAGRKILRHTLDLLCLDAARSTLAQRLVGRDEQESVSRLDGQDARPLNL